MLLLLVLYLLERECECEFSCVIVYQIRMFCRLQIIVALARHSNVSARKYVRLKDFKKKETDASKYTCKVFIVIN